MESKIDLMVKELAKNLGVEPPKQNKPNPPKPEKKPDNKPTRRIVTAEEIDIDGMSLKEISEKLANGGNKTLADGLLALAELINLTDECMEKMYNLMKPDSASKAEYLLFAAELLNEFKANKLCDIVLRKMSAFEQAGMLSEQK